MNWILPIMAAAGLWFGQACSPVPSPESNVLKPDITVPKQAGVESETDLKVCLSSEEHKLAGMVNQYRGKKGLKAVPISASLSHVSQLHVREMQDKLKTLTHSWVDCPYNNNRPKSFKCMWEKPRELTGYPGYGYECAYYQYGYKLTAESILKGWKESHFHNDVIVNRSIWKDKNWQAMGVGIYGNYAVIWFGEETDPNGKPDVCR